MKNLKTFFLSLIIVSVYTNASAQNISTDTTLANKYFNKAKKEIKAAKFDSVSFYLNKAQSLYIKYLGKKSLKNADILNTKGILNYKTNRDKLSLEFYFKSLAIRKEILGEKNINVATSYINIADTYSNSYKLDDALKYYFKGLAIFKKLHIEKKLVLAHIYRGIGESYINKFDFDSAINYLSKALEIYRNILGEKNKLIAGLYIDFGNVYVNKSELNKALTFFFKTLNINKELYKNDNYGIAVSYVNIGRVYLLKSLYSKAIEYNIKGLTILKKLYGENNRAVAICYLNAGVAYNSELENEKALEYMYKSLHILKKILGNKSYEVSTCYTSIANVYYSELRYDKSIEYHLKSLEITKELSGEKSIEAAYSYTNLGVNYMGEKEYDKSLAYYFKSLEIEKKILGEKSLPVGLLFNNIGAAYYYKKDYNKSLKYHLKSLALRKKLLGEKQKDVSMSYQNVGKIYYLKGDYQAALENYQKGIASCLENFNDTINVYSVPTISNIIDWHLLMINLQAKAELITTKNKQLKSNLTDLEALKLALRHYQACDTLINMTRKKISQQSDKLALGEMATQVYTQSIDICYKLANSAHIKQNKAIKYKKLAFYFSEQNKSMVLLQALAGQKAQKLSGIPDTILEKEHNLKNDINLYHRELVENKDSNTMTILKDKLFAVNQQYETLIKNIKKNNPAYYNLKYKAKHPSVKNIQKILDNKTAILSYVVADSAIYIFTLRKNNIEFKKIKKSKKFEENIEAFRNSITISPFENKSKARYSELAFRFYQQLFPDSVNLKGIKKLLIIPNGILYLIPFEALITSPVKCRNLKTNEFGQLPYLIKKYCISYSSSVTLFYETFYQKNQTEIKNMDNWIAFAPIFSDKNKRGVVLRSSALKDEIAHFAKDSMNNRGVLLNGDYISPLLGTKIECKAIFKEFEKKNLKAKIQLYKSANEQFIKSGKLKNYKIIHFATHGFVNSDNPELSGILLSQDTTGGNDGILYSDEIYNLQLNANLVVLSACETALGQIKKGEGIIGLTRALIYAGSKNVIVSLWQVADNSTTNLMIDFYKNYLNIYKKQSSLKKLNFSTPLHDAKLKMIEEKIFSHPFFWSPFILIGK